jgi:hypothetical protein
MNNPPPDPPAVVTHSPDHGCRPNPIDCAVCHPELHIDCGCPR